MQESMYRYMRVGILHFMAYPEVLKEEGSYLETLQKIAEDDFFTAVEVCEVKDDRVKEKVKKLLKTAHLSVAYCAHPKILTRSLDLNSFSQKERKKAVDQIKIAVDEAYEIGAEELIFLSGKDPGEERRDDARRLLTFSIKDICAYAKSRGDLRITLEIFDREVEKRCLIGPADEARMVAEEVRREFDNFGLLVDLSHIPLLNETPAEAILPVKDYLVHAHLGNCVLKDAQHPAYGDSHPRFGIEGGENDVEEVVKFLEVLFEVGFLNEDNPPMVSFEIKPLADESAQVVIANAKRVLREAWVRLNI
ncbi:sugar phosphate isomerase/epimerase [Candidatus Aerophobetes bacterium]|uniref:Sugar phosphate isomerase/epimerase n=1 Tax=Aerophobetes bacterium TaxID=2030807 RepID=A0A662DM66_UNCAE|nr:MAG: sugar phosphate isomerase/epimerase [Candidatus Aerophobetes bacterium]